MRNPWLDYDPNFHGFHPLDEEVATRFNAGKKMPPPEKYLLHPEDNAQPFFGNHEDPAVAILMANPGFVPAQAALEQTPERRKLLDLSRRHELKDNPFVFLRHEFAGTPGYDWWVGRTKELRAAVGDDVFMKNTFSGEIHAYHSVNYRPIRDTVRTFEYTAHLVRNFMQNEAQILIRSKDWFRVLPELESYKNLHRMTNPIVSYITQRSVADNGFESLVAAYQR
jgi:hypothetical protein